MHFARLMQLQPFFPTSGELGSAEARTSPDAGGATGRQALGDADAPLIERIAAGDRQALGDLMARHADRAALVTLRIVRRHDIAQAVVDDVFAEVWASKGRCVEADGSFRAWLCRAVVMRCRPRDDTAEGMPAANQAQAEVETGQYDGPALDRAMGRLAWAERVAIVLAYHEGASVGHIARALQIERPNVEVLLTMARRSLFDCLAPKPTRSAAELAGCKIEGSA